MPAITIPQGLETAGTIVTGVRDRIPDPCYSSLGVAQPDADGSFMRAQSLYRFLTNALRDLSLRIGYTVEDWWAMPITALQTTYPLDARWQQISDVFVNQYRCTFLDEPLTLYPAASSSSGSQSLTFGWHKRAGLLELSLWFGPSASDPTTTLNGALTATTDTIVVTSASSFLSYGWLRIDNELLQYQNLGTNQVSVCRRGASGTTAAIHSNGATVYHCGLWVKGVRTPNPVTAAADLLEIPLFMLPALESYVLAQVRYAEQAPQEAQALMKEYYDYCTEWRGNPQWQSLPGHVQVAAYGGWPGGVAGVYPIGPFGTLIG